MKFDVYFSWTPVKFEFKAQFLLQCLNLRMFVECRSTFQLHETRPQSYDKHFAFTLTKMYLCKQDVPSWNIYTPKRIQVWVNLVAGLQIYYRAEFGLPLTSKLETCFFVKVLSPFSPLSLLDRICFSESICQHKISFLKFARNSASTTCDFWDFMKAANR